MLSNLMSIFLILYISAIICHTIVNHYRLKNYNELRKAGYYAHDSLVVDWDYSGRLVEVTKRYIDEARLLLVDSGKWKEHKYTLLFFDQQVPRNTPTHVLGKVDMVNKRVLINKAITNKSLKHVVFHELVHLWAGYLKHDEECKLMSTYYTDATSGDDELLYKCFLKYF